MPAAVSAAGRANQLAAARPALAAKIQTELAVSGPADPAAKRPASRRPVSEASTECRKMARPNRRRRGPDARPRRQIPRTGARASPTRRAQRLAICGLLVLAVGTVFAQTAGFEFVNIDDDEGVYANPLVTAPLTPQSIMAVFTGRHVESWAPLTCLSHLLVWHLLGQGPGVHHAVNAALHALAAVVLFLARGDDRPAVAQRAGGPALRRPSAAGRIGGLGDRAEGRAQRTVLHAGVRAYVRYAGKPSLGRYLPVLACFVMSLAAKPMAVTLPFLLLLLDYWPLGRLWGRDPGSGKEERERAGPGERELGKPLTAKALPLRLLPRRRGPRVIWEKLPMLAIAGLFCLWTPHAQPAATMAINEHVPLGGAPATRWCRMCSTWASSSTPPISPPTTPASPDCKPGASPPRRGCWRASVLPLSIGGDGCPFCWSAGSGIWA